jgi:acyl-CoA thioester hydrolase
MNSLWQAPHNCPVQTVEADWIDYNGHLNMAFYHVMFDRAVDHVYDRLDIGAAYVAEEQGSCFTMEVHVNYINELVLNDPVAITFQLLDHDSKRLHYYQEMVHAETGELAATSEQLAMHVDMKQRASAPFPARQMQAIEELMSLHESLPRPERVGRRMGIRHKAT